MNDVMMQRRISVEKCVNTLTSKTLSSVVTTRVTHLNQKEERNLNKTKENLDLERRFANSWFEAHARRVKSNLKQFQNRTSKIKSKLSFSEIMLLKGLELQGKIQPVMNMQFSPSRKIATASKRMKNNVRERVGSKSAFQPVREKEVDEAEVQRSPLRLCHTATPQNASNRLQLPMDDIDNLPLDEIDGAPIDGAPLDCVPIDGATRNKDIKYTSQGLITDFGEIPVSPSPVSDRPRSRIYSAKTRSHKMIHGNVASAKPILVNNNTDTSHTVLPVIQKETTVSNLKNVRIVFPDDDARHEVDLPDFQNEEPGVKIYPISQDQLDGIVTPMYKQHQIHVTPRSSKTPTMHSNNQFSSHEITEKGPRGALSERNSMRTPTARAYDLLDTRTGTGHFEERRLVLLKHALAHNVSLEERKSHFMGNMEKFVRANRAQKPRRSIAAVSKDGDDALDEDEVASRLRRGRRPTIDMKNTRCLRIDQGQADLSGLVALGKNQLKMPAAMNSAPRRNLITR